MIGIVLAFYLWYRWVQNRWLYIMNSEINQSLGNTRPGSYTSTRSRRGGRDNQGFDQSSEQSRERVRASQTDQGSQCEDQYLASNIRTIPIRLSTSEKEDEKPLDHGRERLIPTGTNLASFGNNPNYDYDKISYVKTQEVIQEIEKHPNIFEIKLSKETESIVKEIRKELNRYNFKKIIAEQENSTSDA